LGNDGLRELLQEEVEGHIDESHPLQGMGPCHGHLKMKGPILGECSGEQSAPFSKVKSPHEYATPNFSQEAITG
jgi:hypothetical protein